MNAFYAALFKATRPILYLFSLKKSKNMVCYTVPKIWSATLFQKYGLLHCSKNTVSYTVPKIWSVTLFQKYGLLHCSKNMVSYTVPNIWSVHCPKNMFYTKGGLKNISSPRAQYFVELVELPSIFFISFTYYRN